MLKRNERFYHRAMLGILGIVALLIFLTFRDYGITWDEELQSQYGLAVVDYYASGFTDNRYAEIFNLYLYGGMFDGFASLIDQFTPYKIYDTRHLLNALVGLLGLWGTWRLGWLMGGGPVGLLALLFLTLTPVFYGHMFNNPKDIPFATGIIWSLYYMVRLFDYTTAHRPYYKNAFPLMLKLALIMGLTLGVRVGGLMVLIFWLVPLGLGALVSNMKAYRLQVKPLCVELLSIGFRYVLPIALLSYFIMLLCWPWAQQSPILNPLSAFNEFRNFPHNVEVLLLGTTYMSTHLPWYYLPVYFGIQLPEFILVLLAASLLVLPLSFRSMDLRQRQILILFALTAFVPPIYAVIRHPALYDTVRHFLFVVPLVCVLCAATAHTLYIWCLAKFPRHVVQGSFGVALALSIVVQVALMVRLHPYEYIYANRLTGGVAGAFGKFELDYWGTSFKDATNQLQTLVAKEGGVPNGKMIRIAICGPWSAAMINLPPDYEPVTAEKPADYFLSTTRWMCHTMREGKEVIRIERFGVPLAVVKDVRGRAH